MSKHLESKHLESIPTQSLSTPTTQQDYISAFDIFLAYENAQNTLEEKSKSLFYYAIQYYQKKNKNNITLPILSLSLSTQDTPLYACPLIETPLSHFHIPFMIDGTPTHILATNIHLIKKYKIVLSNSLPQSLSYQNPIRNLTLYYTPFDPSTTITNFFKNIISTLPQHNTLSQSQLQFITDIRSLTTHGIPIEDIQNTIYQHNSPITHTPIKHLFLKTPLSSP